MKQLEKYHREWLADAVDKILEKGFTPWKLSCDKIKHHDDRYPEKEEWEIRILFD
jgi:hypothetical protein